MFVKFYRKRFYVHNTNRVKNSSDDIRGLVTKNIPI
jgi:hypothetical protein